MLLLEKIISEIPKKKNTKYTVNTPLLFEEFLDYEVDIPDDIYDRQEEKGLIGSAVCYLESIKGIEIIAEDNSYEWIGRLTHDFHLLMAETKDDFYVAIQIDNGNELRCHGYYTTSNNVYTDAFLLRFESLEEFHELLDEIVLETQTSKVTVDGRSYLVTPQLDNETLRVTDAETNEEIEEIYASTDEEFADKIRKRSEVKKLMLVLKNRMNDKQEAI